MSGLLATKGVDPCLEHGLNTLLNFHALPPKRRPQEATFNLLFDRDFSSADVTGSGVELRVAQAGPHDGRPVMLLHGFPDSSRGWRNQIGPLAAAGLRVIVPDMRGYGSSDAPVGVDAYRLDLLVADVIALTEAIGIKRCHLVGHDWGGIVAWAVAARHPKRVRCLSILNAPHLDVGPGIFRRHPSQLLRSAYIGFFQLNVIAEAVLRARHFAMLKRMIRATGKSDTFDEQTLNDYAREWDRPGRLTAMLNYYRALVQRRHSPLGRIEIPVQILWGMGDVALNFAFAEASLAMCADGRLRQFFGASHWPQLDQADAVTAALLSFDREVQSL